MGTMSETQEHDLGFGHISFWARDLTVLVPTHCPLASIASTDRAAFALS